MYPTNLASCELARSNRRVVASRVSCTSTPESAPVPGKFTDLAKKAEHLRSNIVPARLSKAATRSDVERQSNLTKVLRKLPVTKHSAWLSSAGKGQESRWPQHCIGDLQRATRRRSHPSAWGSASCKRLPFCTAHRQAEVRHFADH